MREGDAITKARYRRGSSVADVALRPKRRNVRCAVMQTEAYARLRYIDEVEMSARRMPKGLRLESW